MKKKKITITLIVIMLVGLIFGVIIPNEAFKRENNHYSYSIRYSVLSTYITTDEKIDTNNVFALIFDTGADEFKYFKLSYLEYDEAEDEYVFSRAFIPSDDVREIKAYTKTGAELSLVKESESDKQSRETGKIICKVIGSLCLTIPIYIGLGYLIYFAIQKIKNNKTKILQNIQTLYKPQEQQTKPTEKQEILNNNLKQCPYCGAVDSSNSLQCTHCGAAFDK